MTLVGQERSETCSRGSEDAQHPPPPAQPSTAGLSRLQGFSGLGFLEFRVLGSRVEDVRVGGFFRVLKTYIGFMTTQASTS